MVEWVSLANVADDLGFPQFRDDPDQLSKEVRKIITRLHPDRTGGVFKTKNSEDRFHKAKAAEEFIASASKSNSVVRVSDLREIVDIISRSQVSGNRESSGVLSERYSFSEKQRSAKRFFPIRIGSGVISSVIIFLIAFPKTFAENPILGDLIRSESFQQTSLFALFFLGAAFLSSYIGERRLEARIDHAMSESALGELVREISFRANHYDGKITLSNITEAMSEIMGYRPSWQPKRISELVFMRYVDGFSTRPDKASMEKAALVQTQRLIENGILKKSDKPSLETTYLIDSNALDDL